MRGIRTVDVRLSFLTGIRLRQHTRLLCSGTNNETKKAVVAAKSVRDFDAYRQLEKLNFLTAVKILFTTPPKKKKFGLDFHLVQLFFACMPSLAVYLVAQYARYEIRRMEAEVELKKKQAEEKAKEMEASAMEATEEVNSDPELLKVKVRLDALEEAVKEIAVESKKLPRSSLTKDQEETTGVKLETFSSNSNNKSEDSSSAEDDPKPSLNTGASEQDSSQDTVSVLGPQQDQRTEGRKAGNGPYS